MQVGVTLANNPHASVASRNTALNYFDVLNSGHVLGYDGTQPANADTALGAQVLLFDCSFGSTAFAAASAGSKTANSITDDSSANNSGTLSWMTLVVSSRASIGSLDMSAGTSGADANFNTTTITATIDVAITSLVLTAAA